MCFTLFVVPRLYWVSWICRLLTSLALENAQQFYLIILLLNYSFYPLHLRLQWYGFWKVSLYLLFSYPLFSSLLLSQYCILSASSDLFSGFLVPSPGMSKPLLDIKSAFENYLIVSSFCCYYWLMYRHA